MDRKTGQNLIRIGSFLLVLFPAWVAQAQGNGQDQPTMSEVPALEVAPEQSSGFWAIVFSGGWFSFIILLALVILSMFAVYLIVEQAMTLRKNEVMPRGMAEEVRQFLAQGRFQDADAACRKRPSPLSFVLLTGLSEIDYGWQAMEKAMEDAVAEQAAKLYRKIEYLSVIGNLAPMCGLLGTVTGMIFAFQQVAISQGTAGAADLAAGIYSALVTTVAGLIVAIPALGAFAVLRNRIDQLIAEAAYVAQHVFSPVRRRVTKQAPRPVAPPGMKPSGSGSLPPRPPQGAP
jgi:biopolymer transport protein ExbB